MRRVRWNFSWELEGGGKFSLLLLCVSLTERIAVGEVTLEASIQSVGEFDLVDDGMGTFLEGQMRQ